MRPELAKLLTDARKIDNELAEPFAAILEKTADGLDTLLKAIEERNAMLAEMSGALAQLMGTADKPKDPNTARYFADALDRARAIQEMYSRQLGNG